MSEVEVSFFPLKSPVYIFSLIIAIIFFVPIVARRFKIPDIIIFIISGLFLGPHGLKIIDFHQGIELFATIGLIYIMFLAGLEIDIKTFKKNKYKSLLFGIFTFIIPLIIGFTILHKIFNYDFKTSVLMGVLFSTQTLISYPIINKYNLSREESVGITVGGTLITDTLVLLVLAVVCKSNEQTNNIFSYFYLFLFLSGFIIIAYKIIPSLNKWFFSNFDYEKNYQFSYTLTILFICAAIVYFIGIEPIVGAFIAGLLLNSFIPRKSLLMDRIQFIGYSIFIPIFLVNVGMFIDLKAFLHSKNVFLLIIVLIFIAFLSKWLAAFLTQKIFKLSVNQRNIIFGLSSAHAIVTLAVLTVGNKAGIIEANFINIGIIIILVSCLASAIITEKSARKIKLEYEATQNKYYDKKEIHTINISFSNPQNIEKLIDFAILLSHSKENTNFYVSTVLLDSENIDKELNEKKKLIENIIKNASATGIKIYPLIKIDLSIHGGILRLNKEIESDILILGTSPQKNFIDHIFGNILDTLIQKYQGNIVMCNLNSPLNLIKTIEVIIPQDFHLEKESQFILDILTNFSQNLSLQMTFFADEKEIDFINKNINYQEFKFFNKKFENISFDLENVTYNTTRTSLYFFIVPRPENITYKNFYNELPDRLIKKMKNNNFIIFYMKKS